MVDVGGYRAQAREALVKKAKDAAEKVRRWGDAVELEPLNAFDRRIVHQALAGRPRRGNAQRRGGRHGQKSHSAAAPPLTALTGQRSSIDTAGDQALLGLGDVPTLL